jgi:hypothetical protein
MALPSRCSPSREGPLEAKQMLGLGWDPPSRRATPKETSLGGLELFSQMKNILSRHFCLEISKQRTRWRARETALSKNGENLNLS